MGCDIHCYIEHKDRDWWSPFGGRINPGRNYYVFEALAGVRGSNALFPPRGLPDDIAYEAKGDAWIFVTANPESGEGSVTREKAQYYVEKCGSTYRPGGQDYISDPDWHSHSWVTPDEWEKAISKPNDFPAQPAYRAMLAAMRSLERDGMRVRVVFWFDN